MVDDDTLYADCVEAVREGAMALAKDVPADLLAGALINIAVEIAVSVFGRDKAGEHLTVTLREHLKAAAEMGLDMEMH
jgi:hypothetical protein